MIDRAKLAGKAIAAALRLRVSAGYTLRQPICVYDLAERMLVEVRFVPLPSLEGVFYDTQPPTIFVSALRPVGRRAYTCAHELGHWKLNHSLRLDELSENRTLARRQDPDEWAAQCFAGALLMPKPAVEKAFRTRNWDPVGCTPAQAFTLAGLFGVGYSTFVEHLRSGVRLLPYQQAEPLLRKPVSTVRESLVGQHVRHNLFVVDDYWEGRAIDAEVGDMILVYGCSKVEGDRLLKVRSDGRVTLLQAKEPGLARLVRPGGLSCFARISRRGFVGRSIFRHLPEESTRG